MANLIDTLAGVARRRRRWSVAADGVTISCDHEQNGPLFQAKLPKHDELWMHQSGAVDGSPVAPESTSVIAGSFEEAVVWLVEHGKRDVLVGDHWSVVEV